MSDETVFAADSIGKSFGRRRVLTSASMWAYSGKVATLVGRNGAGKTTLLKIACGLMRADYGIVQMRDLRMERPRLSALAALGLFYWPTRGLLSSGFSVEDHLDAVKRRFGSHRVKRAVETAEVRDYLSRRPWSLSNGERRRVEMAIMLTRGPSCLLADEPYLGIMPNDREILTGVFRTLAENGCAVILTGHEVSTLFDVADQVYWMTAGTTHSLGTPSEARRHRQFQREYLGTRAGS